MIFGKEKKEKKKAITFTTTRGSNITSITEKNIHVSQGKETGDMEWQAIYKIVANAKQILIYSNRKSAYIIPMEQMGDQYAAFRTLAEQKLEKYKLRMKA